MACLLDSKRATIEHSGTSSRLALGSSPGHPVCTLKTRLGHAGFADNLEFFARSMGFQPVFVPARAGSPCYGGLCCQLIWVPCPRLPAAYGEWRLAANHKMPFAVYVGMLAGPPLSRRVHAHAYLSRNRIQKSRQLH